MKFNKPYNCVSGGSGDVLANPVYLLNLKNEILYSFASGMDCARFLGKKIIPYNNINTPSIIHSKIDKKKYRAVTPEYYLKNIELIKQHWKPYSSYTEYKANFSIEYQLYYEGDLIMQVKDLQRLADKVGITKERVRQLIVAEKAHKSTGYFFKKIIVDNNEY